MEPYDAYDYDNYDVELTDDAPVYTPTLEELVNLSEQS